VSSASEPTSVVSRVPGVTARRCLWVAFGVVWLGAAGAGLWTLWAYENRPGVGAKADTRWPDGATLAREPGRATLVMLAHPQCVCTRASVAELAEVLARARTRPKSYVVFLKPSGFAAGWEQTDLWRRAAALPDATVLRDDEGRLAKTFGAETSGQTMLYGADGTLLFSGGITGARGHAGRNAGRIALLALLDPLENEPGVWTRVFGCSLFSREPDRSSRE